MRRRDFLAGTALAGATALAGCTGGGDGPEPVDAEYGDWFERTPNFDGEQEFTDTNRVTVTVGANDGLTFEPPAIVIRPGTTVVWEWAGRGGGHNVVAQGGSFKSEISSEKGHVFEFVFRNEGLYRYFCEPHQSVGMKGGVRVVNG